jgi:hypothetical protein
MEWLVETKYAMRNITRILQSQPNTVIQYYALATLYYSTGGDTGHWVNDRLWLNEEAPPCDWGLVMCFYLENTTTTNTTSHMDWNNNTVEKVEEEEEEEESFITGIYMGT